ncbi:reverse transcriptase domain-containing protein [Tanacetum coccineum]
MMKKVLADQKGQNVEVYLEDIVVKSKDEQSLMEDLEETLNKLKWVNMKIDPNESTFGMKEGRFLGYTITEDGIRPDPAKVQAVMKIHTLRGPDQIRHLSLQLASIGKFIPKLAELMLPIRKVHQNLVMAEGPSWTSEAEEAFRKIKRKFQKLQTLTMPKKGEVSMLCLRQKSETISPMLFMERGGVQIPISYVSLPLQDMETCYTLTKKTILALIHTARSLRITFQKHQIKVVTNNPMEEILKIPSTGRRLAKWAAEVRLYNISYI